jgi:hypothetical protein
MSSFQWKPPLRERINSRLINSDPHFAFIASEGKAMKKNFPREPR